MKKWIGGRCRRPVRAVLRSPCGGLVAACNFRTIGRDDAEGLSAFRERHPKAGRPHAPAGQSEMQDQQVGGRRHGGIAGFRRRTDPFRRTGPRVRATVPSSAGRIERSARWESGIGVAGEVSGARQSSFTVMPSSSASSRITPVSAARLASSLPPGNSSRPAAPALGRCADEDACRHRSGRRRRRTVSLATCPWAKTSVGEDDLDGWFSLPVRVTPSQTRPPSRRTPTVAPDHLGGEEIALPAQPSRRRSGHWLRPWSYDCIRHRPDRPCRRADRHGWPRSSPVEIPEKPRLARKAVAGTSGTHSPAALTTEPLGLVRKAWPVMTPVPPFLMKAASSVGEGDGRRRALWQPAATPARGATATTLIFMLSSPLRGAVVTRKTPAIMMQPAATCRNSSVSPSTTTPMAVATVGMR